VYRADRYELESVEETHRKTVVPIYFPIVLSLSRDLDYDDYIYLKEKN